MLVRSAGRRQHHRRTSHILAQSFAQLQLPWLAPAQLRWAASQAATTSSTAIPLRRRAISRTSRATAQIRRLATAADHYSIHQTNSLPPPPPSHATAFGSPGDEHVPFDFGNSRPSIFSSLDRSGDDPVIVNHAHNPPDDVLKARSRRGYGPNGTNGTNQQLLSHLHTAIGVGRRDRAQTIVQRLTENCGIEAPETLYAHTAYLEDLLKSLAAHGRDSPQCQEMLKQMQKWFEVEVCNKSVRFDDKVLIIMIRAAIRALDGSRRERSIRRYTEMASTLGEDAFDEVLNSEDYDDNEYVVLQRVTEQYYEHSAEAVEAAEAAILAEPTAELSSPPVGAAAHESTSATTIDLETIPEVLETEQKGVGLKGVKQSMRSILDLPSLSPEAPTEEQLARALERQKALEQSSVEVAIDRWRKADEDLKKVGIHTALQSKPLAALMWQWHQALLPAIEAELAEIKEALGGKVRGIKNNSDRLIYGPYLELLPTRKIAASTILFTMQSLASGKNRDKGEFETEMRLHNLTIGLANSLEEEYSIHSTLKKNSGKPAKASSKAKRPKKAAEKKSATVSDADAASSKVDSKKKKSKLSRQAMLAQISWESDAKVKLGAFLMSKLIEVAQLPVTREHPRTKQPITQMQPAFMHRMKFSQGKKKGMVMPNPALIEKFQSEPVGSVLAKRMPMVVEPRPWEGWNTGGYLHYPTAALRLVSGDKSGKDYFLAAHEQGQLDTVYKGLTALGKTPWKVNQDVFRVQLEAWNSGEGIANFAPLSPEIKFPEDPGPTVDVPTRRKYIEELQRAHNERSGLHSKRCFQNFQLEIARTLLNETLYMPHNLDFRGRAYPIPPYLNHMGADNVRGLLTFGAGKPLGETGLRWLKIHLATVAGHDKASMAERIEYTMNHLDDIYDSVRNPLDGRRWWLKAEDAWQTLAACFELTKALDSPNPTQFISHLPVQQDGTCNGLQHYAALGGDRAGAAQVNLEPSDRPADVYTAVMEAVKKEVEKDAELGNPVAQKLNGRLTRKCVKQPVMTNVYGVTFYGAREQVRKQLEVVFPEVDRWDPVNYGNMGHYVAEKIFKSLGQMFTGAQAIQHWLGQCADRISMCLTPEQIDELKDQKKRTLGGKPSKSEEADGTEPAPKAKKLDAAEHRTLFKSTVVWTTPLRLPVVQPYRTSKARIISTTMQNMSLVEPQVWDPVSRRKQLQAFPPNFIHSLDATHMLLSAIECTERGMTFASIHDSFWTHACDVDQLSTVLRDAFVAMHSEDIIGRLRDEFQARYKGCMYLASVMAHSPIGRKINEIRNTIKKDKSIKSTELAMEAERMRLMNSEDPEERAKGEAMQTPGSLLQSEADESAFAVPSEMYGQKLGEIPASVPGVKDDQEDSNFEDEHSEPAADESEVATKTAKKSKKAKLTKATLERKLYVWLPLTFPEVPKKGDFDVKRLRESQYFFH